jgi:uracil-DNA glycosylase
MLAPERRLEQLAQMGIHWPALVARHAAIRPDDAAPAEPPVATASPTLGAPATARPLASEPAPPIPPPSIQPTPPQPAISVPMRVSTPGADRATGVESMSWDELRAAVAGCRACSLCEGRTQTVFGVGHPQAHWMIVGEAPGEQEDLRGEPFVGAAGQLLDQMLKAVGLTRGEAAPERQVFIANTLKCRPPRNRNPEPGELAACEPYLQRQITLVQPRLILAMGRFAAQQLLRSTEAIGRLRGRVHRLGETPVVVTYHPAYLLRNPVDKARAWEDLCLALEVLET